jgi:hypothetical protein
MKTPTRHCLSQISRLLAKAPIPGTALLDAVERLLLLEPSHAGLYLWAKHGRERDVYFRRVLAYACAKGAPEVTHWLWGPLHGFVAGPQIHDDGTLTNVITALQLYEDDDNALLGILAPEFGRFLEHCVGGSNLVLDAVVELITHFGDRSLLSSLLSRHQAERIRVALSERGAVQGSKEALGALRSVQTESVPDATETLSRVLGALDTSQFGTWNSMLHGRLAEVLQVTLGSYESRREAQGADGVVQELRLDGGDSALGRIGVDVFEKVLHAWSRVLREGLGSLGKAAAIPKVHVLAPTRGSFILRFLVHGTDRRRVQRVFDDIFSWAQKPETLLDAAQREIRLPLMGAFASFLGVLAERRIDAILARADAQLFVRDRDSIVAEVVRPILSQLEQLTHEHVEQSTVLGRLESASHSQGTFELAIGSNTIRGEVPVSGRSMLLEKVIGESYEVVLEKRRTRMGIGDERIVFTMQSIRGNEAQTLDEETAAGASSERALVSGDVPQQDNLDRVIQVVRIVAAGTPLRPRAMGMENSPSSRRHMDYMRHAAKVLGLLTERGLLTDAGKVLAALPRNRCIEFLSLQFEVCAVARRWKTWAEVDDVRSLDETSAVEFLRQEGLSPSMAVRRGRTLSRWVASFKKVDPDGPPSGLA